MIITDFQTNVCGVNRHCFLFDFGVDLQGGLVGCLFWSLTSVLVLGVCLVALVRVAELIELPTKASG